MANENLTIKERIMLFVENSRVPKGKFFDKVGITSANFRGKAKYSPLNSTAIASIISEFPDLSLDWLLTGVGEMYRMNAQPAKLHELTESKITSTENTEAYYMVPLINMDVVGGFHGNEISIYDPQYIERMIPFVDAQRDDICIRVTGNSMSPTCPSGSLVLVREVEQWREYFGYGNIYCILLTDGRRILKEIQKYDTNSKEYVLCVSHNEDVPDEELPRSMIVRVWRVIKILMETGG